MDVYIKMHAKRIIYLLFPSLYIFFGIMFNNLLFCVCPDYLLQLYLILLLLPFNLYVTFLGGDLLCFVEYLWKILRDAMSGKNLIAKNFGKHWLKQNWIGFSAANLFSAFIIEISAKYVFLQTTWQWNPFLTGKLIYLDYDRYIRIRINLGKHWPKLAIVSFTP